MLIYISGPITGYENGNRDAFARTQARLVALGHRVINPHNINHRCLLGHEPKTWVDYMKADLTMLLVADAVATITGWDQSKGAKIEVELANNLEIPVFFDVDASDYTNVPIGLEVSA